MGYLHYSGMESFAFDDRLLTHLRTVILGKLNLQESLVLTWTRDGQQHSIWLHPTVPIHFEFDSEATPELNPQWIEQLLALANSSGGLRCVEEPVAR
ncbi:hypothetical protein BMH31_13155 [Leucobacter sp. OLIS6]|uniref:DUF7882 family protein n=2 Tax=Leucobacter TaxID=55968 RepID=UPI000C183660|nr:MULTISPECIES: hypothetical protein [unclassified Leucobacter]PIJ26816.1 hypothetical protein BMH30_11165 [Leucobacter sp. OLES1]PII81366.1 hypothetical protein BMH25_12460 [Leucobacter sp. OLCALW19]PII86034.1 hypothetical protein BMH26_12875 [Leucobacter sp. OLTLW20]PII89930.1 hypothetical protein BMH27_11040 [Leucobacter sp. OLAS13]PII96961.1 hypothetical protein BMH29_11725 [Leucobacter sp. OLDS2]